MSHARLFALMLGGSLLVSLCLLPTAHADEDDYFRSGIYMGAGMGFGWQMYGDDYPDIRTLLPQDAIKTGLGAEFWTGYRFLKFFAAEVQVEYLDRFNSEDDFISSTSPTSTGEPASFEASYLTFGGNIKAYAPLSRVQPFLLVGVGFTRADVAQTFHPDYIATNPTDVGLDQTLLDFSARFGVGVDLYESPNYSIGATASYVLMTGKLEGLDYLSLAVGVQARF